MHIGFYSCQWFHNARSENFQRIEPRLRRHMPPNIRCEKLCAVDL
jgi:hypothetical protein